MSPPDAVVIAPGTYVVDTPGAKVTIHAPHQITAATIGRALTKFAKEVGHEPASAPPVAATSAA